MTDCKTPTYPPLPGSDYGNPQAWANMMQWQFVWLRVVAKVWEEAANPDGGTPVTSALKDPTTNMHDFMCKEFGYELNQHLKLNVEITDDPFDLAIAPGDASKVDPAKNWFTKAHHHVSNDMAGDPPLFPLELTIRIPKAPPVGDQAYDLALYADSGRTYPFTCC